MKSGREKTSAGRPSASVLRMIELGERVALELDEEVQAGGARQVVEAVAVLQLLELRLEHEVEGRAEQAAERRLLLGEAADPEVDVVDAGVQRSAHAPVPTMKSTRVGGGGRVRRIGRDEELRGRAARRQRRR